MKNINKLYIIHTYTHTLLIHSYDLLQALILFFIKFFFLILFLLCYVSLLNLLRFSFFFFFTFFFIAWTINGLSVFLYLSLYLLRLSLLSSSFFFFFFFFFLQPSSLLNSFRSLPTLSLSTVLPSLHSSHYSTITNSSHNSLPHIYSLHSSDCNYFLTSFFFQYRTWWDS